VLKAYSMAYSGGGMSACCSGGPILFASVVHG